MQLIIPVILCGGAGTRLWPLSRAEQPKQFLRLVTDRSLFQETVLRAQALPGRVAAPIVVCNEAHRFLVAEHLRELDVTAQQIVLEPVGRNTAAAVAAAALLAAATAPAGATATLAVLAADHVIADRNAFAAAATNAVEAAAHDRLVTFGVVPNRPETGYGYIRRGTKGASWSDVAQFVEKPDAATAASYVASGDYLWNSGMFVFGARAFLDELARHAPQILAAVTQAIGTARADGGFTRLGAAFADAPSVSIDYAVMEKTDKAAVVALDAGWDDIGSWSALHDVLAKDDAGNALRGDALATRCRNTLIIANGRTVAALGLDGVVIVATDDAVLVMARDEAQNVKQIVERLAKRKPA